MPQTNSPRIKSQNIEIYRDLVYELTQETCNEKTIKKLMEQLGLKYSADAVERLSRVLEFNPLLAAKKGADRDL